MSFPQFFFSPSINLNETAPFFFFFFFSTKTIVSTETLVIDLQLQKETLVIDLQLQKETLVIDLQLQKETLVIDLQLQKDHLATLEITLCYRGANIIIWSKQWVWIQSTLNTFFTSEITTSCHAQMDPGVKIATCFVKEG